MIKASDVRKVAKAQIGVKESPPNSNRTKFGKDFGMNGVPWCAIYEWWDAWVAAKKKESQNPIYKSASAANIQDLTVKCKRGTYIMKKTASKVKRQAMARRVLPEDQVSFDFGEYDCIRRHTGFAEDIDGDHIICNEGNTSKHGSQDNGGAVCLQRRHYSYICCVVRPNYKLPKPWSITKELPVDGDFGYQSRYRMQWWLGVPIDADIGPTTVKALQKELGIKQTGLWTHDVTKALQAMLKKKVDKTLAVDGDFRKLTIKAFQKYLNKMLPKKTELLVTEPVKVDQAVRSVVENTSETVSTATTETKKTKREKWCDYARKCAWPKGTKKKIYSYPNGKRRKEYVKALKKAFKNRSRWRRQTRMGASCDVAVAAVIRALGIDKKFPRGCDDILKYLKSKRGKKYWKCIKEKNWKKWKPFTVVFQVYKSGGKHILIYLGGGWVFNAHYCKKTYPRIERASKIIKKESKCKHFKVFVPR